MAPFPQEQFKYVSTGLGNETGRFQRGGWAHCSGVGGGELASPLLQVLPFSSNAAVDL